MDPNSGEPWSEMDISDLTHSLDYGDTFAQTARRAISVGSWAATTSLNVLGLVWRRGVYPFLCPERSKVGHFAQSSPPPASPPARPRSGLGPAPDRLGGRARSANAWLPGSNAQS